MAERPIGPAPTTATVSPGSDPAVQHPDLVPGRGDVGEHQDRFVSNFIRNGVRRRVGERDPNVLGLGSVDEVTEDPSTSAGAEPVPSLAARWAPPARGDAGDEHTVARVDRLDARPDLLDGSYRLVSQDPSPP